MIVLLTSTLSHAANLQDFNAGRIIDDGIFTNKDSMSAAEIQRFLNGKGVNCQNYQAACLKNYTEGGKVAAQIFYDMGQAYNINPQVLIVLVQKEVGLVLDPQPENWQYKTATGYGCPDSTPGVCDSNYYGFTNQVRAAANMYHKIMTADPNWYSPYVVGTNSILWNPNSSCGRSTVNIQNRATVALYDYTPYRPNAYALGGGTSSAYPQCGAFGNLNFYRYFNDWFGISSSPLIRTLDSPSLYFYDGTRRYRIVSSDQIAEYGINGSYIRYISQTEMDAIPQGDSGYASTLDRLIKSDVTSDVYLLDKATRFKINSVSQLTDMGYSTAMIATLPAYVSESFPVSPNSLSYFFQASDGGPIKLEGQKKRAIFELSVLDNEMQGTTITPLSDYNLGFWQYGNPIVYTDYIARNSAGAIRYYSSNNFFTIPNMSVYSCWNLSSVKTFQVDFGLTNGTDAGNINCAAQDSSHNPFLINSVNKLPLPSQSNLSGVVSATDSMLGRFQTASYSTTIRNPSGAISVLENNIKRPVPTIAAFNGLGLNLNSTATLSNEAYETFPTGPDKLPVGMLVRYNNGAYVISADGNKRYVTNMDTLTSYGFQWNNSLVVSDTDNSYYATESNPLSNAVTDSSNGDKYFITGGYAFLLTASTGTPSVSYQSVPAALLNTAYKINNIRFAKAPNSPAIYWFDSGGKHYVGSWNSYLQHSNNGQSLIFQMNEGLLNAIVSGPAI